MGGGDDKLPIRNFIDRLCWFLFHKYLSNHVLLYAPLNFLFTYFTIGRPGAVFETKSVPGLDKIKENPVIRAEAKVLLDTGVFQRPPAVDEPGYNSFEKVGLADVSSQVVHKGMSRHRGEDVP